MAPLPKVCRDAMRIRAMHEQGRYDESLELLVALLTTGCASAEVQAIAAARLQPPTSNGKRGPKKKTPFNWLEIGSEYEELREDGVSDVEARLILEERHPRGRRTIDKVVAFYNDAMDEYRHETRS